MPRIARVLVPGVAHHITQRGNNRQIVFWDEEDRHQYLEWLKKYNAKWGIDVLAYCLMDNHIHLLCIPQKENSLSNALRDTHMRYSQYANRKYKQSGHLWQGRFFSCPLDDVHMLASARYIERNPVRAKLVTLPEQWQWSSAKAHVNAIKNELLSDDKILLDSVESWKVFITEPDDPEIVENLRKNTLTGRPLGDKDFVSRIETFLNRILLPKKIGRPQINERD